jgi:cytochrome c oxidase subunit 3
MSPASLLAGPKLGAPPRRVRRAGGPPAEPPARDGGGGRGGDGGGGPGPLPADDGAALGRFALVLVVAAITTLFAVLIAVWLLLRRSDVGFAAPSAAPRAFWPSTLSLVASSLAVERAARSRTRNAARRWLGVGLALGLAFLAAQVALWTNLARAGIVPARSGYAAVLFALTGLHALHVSGGLAFLTWLAHALRRAERAPSVRLGALYWHTMGALWLVLVALLTFVR